MTKYRMVALLALLGACNGGGHTDDTNVTPCDEARGECDTDTGTNPGDMGILAINLPAEDPAATVGIGESALDESTSTGAGQYSVDHPVGECDVWVESDTFIYLEKFPVVNKGETTTVAWTEFGEYGYFYDHVDFCDKDNDTREVYTEIRDDAVRLWGLPVSGLPMLGHEFEHDMGEGYVLRGSALEDVITLEYWLDGEKYDEEEFTRGACN